MRRQLAPRVEHFALVIVIVRFSRNSMRTFRAML
jgi:hypothetical protein